MKTLPIQLVHTREEQDRFLKEGMGDNKLPKWATQETVSTHAAMLSETFSAVAQKFDARKDDGLPIMMVATLDEHATARKSFRANVRAVLIFVKRGMFWVRKVTEACLSKWTTAQIFNESMNGYLKQVKP